MEETLLLTQRFQVMRMERQLANGTLKRREIIRHPGSVVILPILSDERVCLIRNYRMSLDQWLVELPAGTLEANESPESCAARELTEETGFRASQFELLTTFVPAPGILDEKMHLFLATDLVDGPAAREPEEEIENMIVPWRKAMELVETGEMFDAKSMIGLLWFDKLCRR